MIGDPDLRPPLDESRLTALLGPTPDLTLELLAEAPSTNQVAAERARSGAADGLLVVADHQVAGRGRLDRTWQTPPGSAVTFSLLLRPDVPPASWPWLPLLTGHTVAKALTALGFDARVKWPNDVLLDGRKVAGILVERVETDSGPAAVVGIGINVGLTAEELPVATATSLAVARPDAVPAREDVLAAVAEAVREGYDAWRAGGPDASARLRSSYADHCATLGQEVRVDLPGGTSVTGRAIDIDPRRPPGRRDRRGSGEGRGGRRGARAPCAGLIGGMILPWPSPRSS
ncbi:biotin--[acetyl-CoA-carboxylase] ligase [Nocardioides sp. TF02-7]|uniref:biotin--[acetyl-CoA-carboxylase] ligase n=1 Tax=Nocardioides sp. TF02-7 TaxID=2917724 RepID=UPI001F066EF9|nr:biotin--[acetyl-CoA-carboxylase] ligase [Nocardioides sp. TF02-7]UMG93236.1 biotin--[acetyl-CoA-carboxylase] ligase [Nocardioides sp. TF02-7]